MTKQSIVKLSDIAQRLGVSSVTISKALRGHPDISAAMTKQVRELAAQMGYVPNLLARSLSSKRSQTVGVIIPKIAHFFFGPLVEAIYAEANLHHYNVILMSSQEDAEIEKQNIRSLIALRVDGILISVSANTKDPAPFEMIKQRGIPLTFFDRIMEMEGVNTVTVDDRGGAFMLTEQAIKVGHRRLAHIGGFQHTSIGKARFQGFKDALKKYNIPLNPALTIFGGFDEESGYQNCKKLLATRPRPEFIFAATFPIALGIYRVANEMGLRIPRDLDVMTFAHNPMNSFLNPPMTLINQPAAMMGKVAFEVTLEHIQKGEEYVPKHIQLETKLIIGKTGVARARSSSKK